MKVFLDTVGCRLNQSEIERIANQFLMAGHSLVDCAEKSDLIVINTCTVTTAAAADSRSKTRRAHRENSEAKIILTGCWSTLAPTEALSLPGVHRTIDNEIKDQLFPILLDYPDHSFELDPVLRRPVPGLRMRTRSFIKVQDGCDNHCTFCITKLARGRSRSISLERVIADVRACVRSGVQEAVLTGVQLSAYGKDIQNGIDLKVLVSEILDRTDIPRLRLSSLEPWALPNDFFDLWDNPRLCRQLHLPLQSGSSATLRRMARPIQPGEFKAIIDEARNRIPSLAITTDIIVGFPGVNEDEFQESLAFIKAMEFADAHVFTYSPRPGTAAMKLPDPVPNSIAKERSWIIREVVHQSALNFKRQFIGKELIVLWESATSLNSRGWEMNGLTDNYIRVRANVEKNLWNLITHVKALSLSGNDLHVEVIHSN
ncbi:MAG: tRNA (N(6)-L-threonylcarbamoyladenosine(37)-C(2))-methylthiotransferase MtaB [Anaerolineales bacterium]|nr:tRNA (N(6)-L-threonylcarbamoyladenosine(37)-C(2))-methylthiotransferase MtaB [Anaerolineales bacterium]